MFVGGVFMSQVNNDYQENVEVALLGGDEWELSPENIILDGFLGEGEFGTVYKSRLMGNISTPLLESCEGSVVAAIKLLRGQTFYYICTILLSLSFIMKY